MESVLVDAAGRRRSPATLSGYQCGRPPRNQVCATRRIRRVSRKSSLSCATPGNVRKGCAFGG
jgi:hypothetical protein